MKSVVTKANLSDIESMASAWIASRDAGMTKDEQAEFERWKAADKRHALAWMRHEQVWKLFDRPRAEGLAEIAISKLGTLRTKRHQRRIKAVTGGLLVLAMIVGGIGWERHWASFPADVSAHVTNAIVSMPESRTLPDGSVVELKKGAEIAVDFSGALRRVRLFEGEAHFHVAKNAARPFVVSASGVDIKAVGTAFVVQVGSRQVEVLVTEGRIAVDHSDKPSPAVDSHSSPKLGGLANETTFANAGNRVVVDLPLGSRPSAPPVVTAVSEFELSQRLAWRSTRLEFTGTPLGEAVQLINLHGHVRLRIDPADAGLADLQVSGYFRADNVETFLRLIGQTLEIQTERSGDTIVLRKSR